MPELADPPRREAVVADPITIPDCRLTVIDKEDVPSQKEGVIVCIGTEIQPGEKVPEDRIVKVTVGKEEKKFRRLQEGDIVKANQLLALLDDRLARAELGMARAKLEAAKAELEASEKTRDEALTRFKRRQGLVTTGGATSKEELDGAKLTWERYIYEAIGKRAAIALSESEVNKAETTLQMHEIRSAVPVRAIIKTIYKKPGEFVKASEPVFQLQGLAQLRHRGHGAKTIPAAAAAGHAGDRRAFALREPAANAHRPPPRGYQCSREP